MVGEDCKVSVQSRIKIEQIFSIVSFLQWACDTEGHQKVKFAQK